MCNWTARPSLLHSLFHETQLATYPRAFCVRRQDLSPKSQITPDQARFFKELGRRIRALRVKAGYSQADMESFGFSVRHWQQVETGRPTSVTTLLRVCSAFKVNLDDLIRGLDQHLADTFKKATQPNDSQAPLQGPSTDNES